MSDFFQQQLADLEARIAENQALHADPDLAELATAEIARLEEQKLSLLAAQKQYSAGSDDETEEVEIPKNCIIELRAGTGGDEAKIWAKDLQRMYLRYCEVKNLKVEMRDELEFRVRGRVELGGEELTAYQLFQFESGVHRVQRVPATESQGRIHTSTASVAVLPEISAKAIEIRSDELQWHFTRAGGNGGQNVNKVNTAVELTHVPTGIKIESRKERYQERNREIALEVLRARLWEMEDEKRLLAIGNARAAIGRNMRSEKIRTYNYAQNRVTDHRINVSWHDLSTIVEGNLEKLLTETHENMREETE